MSSSSLLYSFMCQPYKVIFHFRSNSRYTISSGTLRHQTRFYRPGNDTIEKPLIVSYGKQKANPYAIRSSELFQGNPLQNRGFYLTAEASFPSSSFSKVASTKLTNHFNHQHFRRISTKGPSQVEKNVNHEASEIPPNVSAEISGAAESVKRESQETKAEDSANRPLKRSVLRQATRFVVSVVPGQAHVVMQQQHVIARLLGARLRAWQVGRKTEVESDTDVPAASVKSFGRRSSVRRKRSRTAPVAKAGSKPRKGAAAEPQQLTVEQDVTRTGKSQHLPEHLEHSFLKDTAIEENLSECSAPSTASLEVASLISDQKLSINDALPKDLQPSLEVSLGQTSFDRPDVENPDANRFRVSSATSSIGTRNAKEAAQQLDRSEILRNYEAVLQVVLTPGLIEADAKRFLNEYRNRFHIKITQHSEALKRLGWSDAEYDQGYSHSTAVPPWKRLWNRCLDACESGGNYIVTMGSVTSLMSIMMANMAQLRMLQLVSGSLYFLYNVTRRPPLLSSAYWNIVFFLINSIMLTRFFLERRPEVFTDDELDVFEKHFLETGLSPRRFKKLLAAAHWRQAARGEVLVRKGEDVKELMVIHHGVVSIFMNETEVERLEGGDKSAIIGLKTFLTRLDDERSKPTSVAAAASASQSTDESDQARRKGVAEAPPLATESTEEMLNNDDGSGRLPGSGTLAAGPFTPNLLVRMSDNRSTEQASESPIDDQRRQIPGLGGTTSVVVAEDALLLVWSMDGLVRTVVGDPVNLGFPLVGGMAKSLVLRSRNQLLKQHLTTYESAIRGVLADGVCLPEEKKFLQECRKQFHVSEEQHWAFVSQLGWTKEEFESGTRGNAQSIKSILTKVKDQLGFLLPPPSEQQQKSVASDLMNKSEEKM